MDPPWSVSSVMDVIETLMKHKEIHVQGHAESLFPSLQTGD